MGVGYRELSSREAGSSELELRVSVCDPSPHYNVAATTNKGLNDTTSGLSLIPQLTSTRQ